MQYMIKIIKPSLIISAALLVNILLFLIIHQMVTNEVGEVPEIEDINFVDFIRIKEEPKTKQEKEEPEEKKPEEQPPPEQSPPKPKMPQPDIPKPEQAEMDLPEPNIDVPLGVDGIPYLGDFLKTPEPEPEKMERPSEPEIDTDINPTYKTKPVYPQRALRAGIEGIVTVEFTIAKDGTVKNPEIIKADPPEIFNRTVLQAIRRWKFPPQTENGKPIEKRARQDIRFTLRK